MTTSTISVSSAPQSELAQREAPRATQIRVALIGCGAISEQMHLPVLAGHRVLKLAALVDRDRERAQRFAKGYGVEHVLQDAAELSRDDIDAAIIATPPFHHAPCAIALMRKGMHVLVEKPMATNLADAERLVAEAEQAGVVLSVGFFRRLYPGVRLMKSLIDSHWAGRPVSFRIEAGGMYNWSAATLGNMQRDSAGGGVLMDFGSHMIDLLLAMFDEPAEVLDYSDNALGGIEADCSIHLRVRHQGEPLDGRIELARMRELGSWIRIECERATLEWQVSDRFRVKVSPRDAELIDPLSGVARDFGFDATWLGESEDESWYATFGRQYDNWVAAIQSGSEPILSGRSALGTSRLIEACYRNPQRMHEPWVWHGITTATNAPPHTPDSGYPTPHVAGRERRILVTGASGFIGCRVVELLRLREKCEVRAVVHNPGNASRLARLDVEMVQADLGSVAGVRQLVQDCDGVVHCAIGTTYGNSKRIAAVTVGGTERLAAAALAAGVKRFVHLSSMSVYGNNLDPAGLISETTPLCPSRRDSYGLSKAAAERALLDLAKQGLPTVILRPARVFGPFSKTFIINPLRAMAAGRFGWLGPPDVPADMTYVDNVAEAILATLFAQPGLVQGEAFNVSDGSASTWREFYGHFAHELGVDLTSAPVQAPSDSHGQSVTEAVLGFPASVVRGMGQVVTSKEFKSLGRRVLMTDPIGTMPRKAIERLPAFERGVRRLIKADDSMPIYRPETRPSGEFVHMGSGGTVLSIEKLRERLGFVPPVAREDAVQLTLDWVRHARIVALEKY